MPDFSGQSIGRYHIIEQLGQGGMATVYRAYDTRLEREVAIKFIRNEAFIPEMLDQMLKRFEREAKALAKLSHPSIVRIYDFGEHAGSPYLVMELISGGSLKQMLVPGKPLPTLEAIRLMAMVAHALEYAHREGIVHRDIKPGNILLNSNGTPMLTDFGIAKILEDNTSTALTGTGVGMGTPEYMAPEQWFNQATPQTDIYSLGVVFYEMITGHKPYTADTPAAVLLKQANEPLPRPRKYNPNISNEIEQVIYKALAKNPLDRYSDMGAFAAELEKLSVTVGTYSDTLPKTTDTPVIDITSTIQEPHTLLSETKAQSPEEPTLSEANKGKRSLFRKPFFLIGTTLILGLIILGVYSVFNLYSKLQQTSGPVSTLTLSGQAFIPKTETAYINETTPINTLKPTITSSPQKYPTLQIIRAPTLIISPTSEVVNEAVVLLSENFDPPLLISASSGISNYGSDDDVKVGESYLVHFRIKPGTSFNIVLASFNGNDFNSMGIKSNTGSDLISVLHEKNTWLGGQPLAGNLDFGADIWYFILLNHNNAGLFSVRLWESQNPSIYQERKWVKDKEWSDLRWILWITHDNNSGGLEIDMYEKLNLLTIKDYPSEPEIINPTGNNTFQVFANQDWQNTGILIQPGQYLKITYLNGTWSGCAGNSGDYCRYVDANGLDIETIHDNVMQSGCKDQKLIARVSNSSPICVGGQFYGIIEERGDLELRINDGIIGDNGGSVTVLIEVGNK